MTPLGEAEEIFDSFYFIIEDKDKAKQCALILVDSILEITKIEDYYEVVKQEIEKL